jgi:hypothetical protein
MIFCVTIALLTWMLPVIAASSGVLGDLSPDWAEAKKDMHKLSFNEHNTEFMLITTELIELHYFVLNISRSPF